MTYRTKNMVLITGFILALILSYQLAISKTLSKRQDYKTLKKEELMFKNTPKQLSLLKQKLVYYDSILTKYQLHDGSIQNNLLKTINIFADSSQIKVSRFMEPHTVQTGDLKMNNYQFTLEGSYHAILQLVYQLEQQTKFGEIVNFHFEKKKNFKTGKSYLQAHIILKCFG